MGFKPHNVGVQGKPWFINPGLCFNDTQRLLLCVAHIAGNVFFLGLEGFIAHQNSIGDTCESMLARDR